MLNRIMSAIVRVLGRAGVLTLTDAKPKRCTHERGTKNHRPWPGEGFCIGECITCLSTIVVQGDA